MQLIDWLYYTETFEGSIPSTSFSKYAKKASVKVNYVISNRIDKKSMLNNNIRNATCEIAELIYENDNKKKKIIETDKEVASETLGPRSVSYVNKSSLQSDLIKTDEEIDKESYKICKKYLILSGLMDRNINS